MVLGDVDLPLLFDDLEREDVEDELVDHYADAEDICLFAVLLVLDLFGRGVGEGEAASVAVALQ